MTSWRNEKEREKTVECEIRSRLWESKGKMSRKCFILYPDSCVAVHACVRVRGPRRIAVVGLIPPLVIAVIDTVVA